MILSSCSTTQEVATREEAPIYFHKVYRGNKIIYKHNREEQSPDKLVISDEMLTNLEPAEEVVIPLEEPSALNDYSGKEEKLTASSSPSLYSNYDFGALARSLGLSKQYDKVISSDATQAGNNDTLALLGFIFTLTGFLLSLVPGIIALIGFLLVLLGFIFSLIGLDSNRRGLAIAGVVIGGVYLLLFLIVLIAAASIVATY